MYRLSDSSLRYVDTMLSYIAKSVKNIKSRRSLHIFEPKHLQIFIAILTTFTLPCNSNKIHKEAATCNLPHFVKKPVANALNDDMSVESWLSLLTVSVQSKQHQSCNILRSYRDVLSNLFI